MIAGPAIPRRERRRAPLASIAAVLALLLAPAAAVRAQQPLAAESKDHELVLTLANPHETPIENVSLSVLEAAAFLKNFRISPAEVAEIRPGGSVEIRVRFDIGAVEEEQAEARVELQIVSRGGLFDDQTPEFTFAVEGKRMARCNSSVGAGSDRPETIEADLGDFVGKAAFSWQMFTVKDRMTLHVGGSLVHDTGCVGGSDRVVFDVTGAAGKAVVSIEPNCAGTTGTRWTFRFQCPAEPAAEAGRDERPNGGQLPAASASAGGAPPQTPSPGATPAPPSSAAAPATSLAPASLSEASGDAPLPIPAVAELAGTIEPRGDRDRFVFAAPHHGEWRIETVRSPPGVAIATGVFPQGAGWLPDMSGAAAEVLTVDLAKPGDYVLQVAGGDGAQASADPYLVRTAFTPSPETTEPNNDTATAAPVAGTASVVGTILPRGDRDRLVFDAPHPGQWDIRIAEAPSGVGIGLGVFKAPSGGWLPDMAPGDKQRLVVDLPAPGKYVLQAAGADGAMRSVAPYRLQTEFTPSPETTEPNNQTDTAAPVAGTASVVGTILPRGDRDRLVFDAPHHGQWDIRIAEAPPGVGIGLGVFKAPSGGWMPDMAPGDKQRLVVDLPAPGEYVLQAAGADGSMRSVAPYRLEATFTPSPEAGEPNNSTETATPIVAGRAIVGTILPRGDRDRYLIEVARAGELEVAVRTSPPGFGLSMGVFKAPTGGWMSDRDPRPEVLRVEVGEAGAYVVQIAGEDGAARSVLPYEVVVTLR